MGDEVQRLSVTIPISQELLTEHASMTDVMKAMLSGDYTPPPPLPDPPTPAGHLALLAATAGALRAVVKLHTPVCRYGYHQCEGCDIDGYDAEPPFWPCSTVELIGDQVGIDVRQDGDGDG